MKQTFKKYETVFVKNMGESGIIVNTISDPNLDSKCYDILLEESENSNKLYHNFNGSGLRKETVERTESGNLIYVIKPLDAEDSKDLEINHIEADENSPYNKLLNLILDIRDTYSKDEKPSLYDRGVRPTGGKSKDKDKDKVFENAHDREICEHNVRAVIAKGYEHER